MHQGEIIEASQEQSADTSCHVALDFAAPQP
jgi:hypothetical protein